MVRVVLAMRAMQDMSELRAYVFRQKAIEAESKASRAQISESTRRAWLIVAREWTKMAEREEAMDAALAHIAQLSHSRFA
jgi:hypothetical protein